MSSLAYLAGIGVDKVKGLQGKRGEKLREGGIRTVADLLLHAPRRYIDRSTKVALEAVPVGEEVTVVGTVKSIKTRRPRRNLTIIEATIFDGTSYLFAVWFNQTFRERQLSEGAEVALSGKVERFRGRLQMKSPDADVLDRPGESLITGRVVPVHPTVAGIGPGHLRRAIHNAVLRAGTVDEILPDDVLKRHRLVDRDRAINDVHFPESVEDGYRARHRLVFDEFFRIEVALAMRKRRQIDDAAGIPHETGGDLVTRFVAGLPFPLTTAQERVIDEIAADMARPHPMHRLLQGEVGAGKTVVAMAALLTAVDGGYQGAIMAPTEVLAQQHYVGVADLVAGAGLAPVVEGEGAGLGMENLFDAEHERPVTLALLTSNDAEVNFRPRGATRRQDLLDEIAAGRIDIVVGTHALIQEGVHFARLGVAVVDEQHRFGVHQRVQLREKGEEGAQPDLLIMTATPIPRTLGMTLYGDLDVSVLDELPWAGDPEMTEKMRITTIHKTWADADMAEVYRRIRDEVAAGNQAFVVCPLVEDSDKVYAKSATAEHERLQQVFADLRVGLVHGQLPAADKEAVMTAFRDRELDILVATTVIEVGLNIPNSTVMVIEDADRFGLSQLHQLRGRLHRFSGPNWCYLVAEPTTPEGEARIAAMVSEQGSDGFWLAERDLEIRGQGTVFGDRQAGVGDLRLGDVVRDLDVLVAARREAFDLVGRDPRLREHPGIAEEVRALLGEDVEWLFIS